MVTSTRMSDDLKAFVESGLAIVVASRDAELQADGAWGWAARVHEDRAHLTVYLHEKGAAAMLRNLTAHPEVAVALDRPSDHRACQVKGRYVASRPAREEERGEVERQLRALVADLERLRVPPAMTAGWRAWPCTAVDVRVTQLFEQTPGPGAGEPMP